EDILPSQVNNYNYDQLNRIFDMKTWQYLGFNNSSFTVKNSYNSSYEYDRNGNLLKLTRTAPTKPDHPDVVPMDNLSYSYNPSTNQLNYVMDDVHPDTFSVDIDNQKPHNYIYDEIGQLVEDESEKISIRWRVDGKVSYIHNAITGTEIFFQYDGLGNRISKTIRNSNE